MRQIGGIGGNDVERRLYRSNTEKIIGGVCGGLGEYFEIDPVLVRIITVILILGTGLGLLAYIIGWIIIPIRPEGEVPVKEHRYSSWHKYFPGLILIGVGAVLLVREFWYWFDLDELWPVVLILAGLGLILIKGSRRGKDSISVDRNQSINRQTKNGPDSGGAL